MAVIVQGEMSYTHFVHCLLLFIFLREHTANIAYFKYDALVLVQLFFW